MTTMPTIEATEVNVYEHQAANGRKHHQYDFKVTMADGTIGRSTASAARHGATSGTCSPCHVVTVASI